MTPRVRSRRPAVLVLALLALASLVVLAAGPATAATKKPPRLKDPAATGRELSTEFLTILQQSDTAALRKFLDPAFLLRRADGSSITRADYLANPATVGQFVLGDTVTASQHGDVLVVGWSVKSDLTVDGQPYSPVEAPRLSTYHWDGARWRLVAHANFNRPA